jgi:hypothetical protein
MKYITIEEYQAMNLLNLVKDHKEKCDGNCNVSLSALEPVYKMLIKRELTKEEHYSFLSYKCL